MRKLGARLGIAAKTLYNYFESQDGLYLGLLTRGFRKLNVALSSAGAAEHDPWSRMSALISAYMDFALEHVNLYNLMFVWHVPKYDDYVGTAMEAVALDELEVALDNQRLLASTIVDCVGHPLDEDDLRFAAIRIWSQMHGYVAGVNNTLVGYMHPDPGRIHDRMVRSVQSAARAEVLRLAVSDGDEARGPGPLDLQDCGPDRK
jgi:AcrR family transcriptional regulator